MSIRRSSRRGRLVAAVTAVAAVSVGLTASGDAAQLPPGPPVGLVTKTRIAQMADVSRAKVRIDSGATPIYGIVFLGLVNSPVENPTRYVSRTRLADPFYQPACATSDPATQISAQFIRSVIYIGQRGPGNQLTDVGRFPEMKARMLAFGSVPSEATIEITQSRKDGQIVPIKSLVWNTVLNGNTGCGSKAAPYSALLEGPIDIRITSLKVDGVTVPVGPRCATVEPAMLRLWNKPPYEIFGGGELGAYDGLHPGSQGPLTSPLYYEDQGRTLPPSTGLDIPPFSGCGVDEDLDPLITSMASGPNNPISVRQGPLDTAAVANPDDLCDGAPCPPPLPLPGIPPVAGATPMGIRAP